MPLLYAGANAISDQINLFLPHYFFSTFLLSRSPPHEKLNIRTRPSIHFLRSIFLSRFDPV